MLRLPLTQDGLGVPDVRQTIATSRVASRLRFSMVTPLQLQFCSVRCKESVVSHSVGVTRKVENMIPLAQSVL